MSTTDDAPPRRHLHPVEPPFDPEHDTKPHPVEEAARQAERALLGTLLTQPERAGDILPALDPSDFYTPAHEAIWNAAAELLAEGVLPEHPALLRHLATDQVFQRAGGHALLLELRPDADPSGQPDLNATIVREAAAHRRLGTALAAAKRAHANADPTNIRATLEQLVDLADAAATTFGPRVTGPANTGLHDLSWVLTGQAPTNPPPAWAVRTDGTALFYAGRVNGVFGDPESGKTWLAQIAVVEALHLGRPAAMVDVDHNGADHTAARLLLLGATLQQIADPDLFRYYEPEDGEQLRAAVTDIVARRPDVVVLDSLGEMLPMLGVKSVDNDEITAALRTVVMPPAKAGSCVITVDHLPKSVEARTTGYAIGGTAKKRAIDGSYLRADARVQPAPGVIGRITLRIEKDRTGELRKASGGGYAGTFVLDSSRSEEGITTWSIGRDETPKNDDGTFRPTRLMERVSRFIEDNDQCKANDIHEAMQTKKEWVTSAIRLLVTEGFVARIEGARRAQLHHSIAPYRETEDDHVS